MVKFDIFVGSLKGKSHVGRLPRVATYGSTVFGTLACVDFSTLEVGA